MKLAFIAFVMALGCGSSSTAVIGQSNPEPRAVAIELGLRRAGGEWIHLGDLRGQPVLLFFFATFDTPSQAALRPTSRFARSHPDVHVVGIATQPNAPQLLGPYEAALAPAFPLTYDPARNVHNGTSSLGVIAGVPSYIMLDAGGRPVGRHVGFPSTQTLEGLYDAGR